MLYTGIDYSLTSAARATIDTDKKIIECYFFHKKTLSTRFVKHGDWAFSFFPSSYPQWTCPQERYDKIAKMILAGISSHHIVAFENYSFASKGQVYQIGENTGTAKNLLWQAQIKFDTIPPTTIKKAFSGSGKATKDEMAKAFHDKFGFFMHEFLETKKADSSPASDIVDSVAIAWMLSQEFS